MSQQLVKLGHDRVTGREAEMAVVSAFLDANRASASALVVEGEAGIGKTTIVRAALERASAGGCRILAARPAAGEMELPYVGLADLLATATEDALATLAGPQRAAIEAALGREGSSAAVSSHALSRGVLELLSREAAEGDVLLAVDDVQWLDRPTAAALTFALRRLQSIPLRVLVAARTGNGSPLDPPLGLGEWDNVRLLEVGPLTTTELGALIRERLRKQLSRPRLEALRRESGGNPMFALELVQADRDGPRRTPTLTLAIEERLRAVDASARLTLSFAAAALRPSTDLLLRAGVDRAQLRSALETEILEAEGERLSFVHPMLASAAYQLLLPDERRSIHARLAKVSSDAVERGHHVSRSAVAPDELAAELLDEAAEAAATLGDHAGAAAFLLRATELSVDPDGGPAHHRAVQTAAELEMAGDVDAAADLARSLIERLPPGLDRAKARQLLVSAAIGSAMSIEECLAELALAIEDAEHSEALQAELHLAIYDIAVLLSRLGDAAHHARKAIALAERAGATATAVSALGNLGLVECLLGHGVTDAAHRAYALWDGTILSPNGYSPRMAIAFAYLTATELDEAHRLFKEELEMAQERGLEAVEVYARGHLAQTQLRAGHLADALTNARLTVEHARQAANAQTVYGVSYALAMTEALLGHHEEARAIATEGLADAEATHDFWFMVFHRAVLGLVALAEDEPQAAAEVIDPAWALMIERGFGDLSIFPVAQNLGEALVAVARVDGAVEVARTLRACPAGERPWCRAMASRVEALVASVRGDHDSARALIADALEAHADLPEPFELARSLQIAGRVERSARNWRAARAALADALERFDALGAARWSEKAAADIARLPGRRPADKQELTTREREVAELVAAGLANKEVAARLFVSVRTVEANLSKVYAKLGVRSRTELARRLDAADDA